MAAVPAKSLPSAPPHLTVYAVGEEKLQLAKDDTVSPAVVDSDTALPSVGDCGTW